MMTLSQFAREAIPRLERLVRAEEISVPDVARLIGKDVEFVRKNFPIIVHGPKSHHVRLSDVEAYQQRRTDMAEERSMMRVLIACEFSGIVRDSFAARGHDAWSCDLLPTERPGNHIQDDVLKHLETWDLMVAHPPCTRLCNSGVRWLAERDLWREMYEACLFFVRLLEAPIQKVAIENPIPHKYARSVIGPYQQRIDPWLFGEPESKATCLWLKGLPPLMATVIETGRNQRCFKMPPSPERSMNRSRTYQGIANAMATQWGTL